MDTQPSQDFVLGIDLGSNSLGWAMIGLQDGQPAKLLRAGVRVFEAGMDGDIESGQEESRNLKRREARLHRRQLWRRARRLTKVFKLLQSYGLLPPVAPPFRAAPADSADGGLKPTATPEQRQDSLNELDRQILASVWFAAKKASGGYPEPEQTLPYILRAAALDEHLEPHCLGRALYHLAQRRGFLSTRKKAKAAKEEEESVVKQGISELRQKMAEAGARTLGEFFARIPPSEERIRDRWTARAMYEEEFQQIWNAQAKFHPELLTDERKKLLFQAIFYQRPLKDQPELIGHCELEPEERRTPAYLLVSQHFRLLQTVNNLTILPPGEPEKELTPADRAKLIEALELHGDQTFAQIRKLLGRLPRAYTFNLERGGEKSIRGNRTNSDFYAVFGERWHEMSPEERQRAILDVRSIQKPETLLRRAREYWKLDEEAAQGFCDISLEPDYLNLSRRAIEKLLPLLEDGATYGEARRLLYPERFQAVEPLPLVPPVQDALTEIRNPAVTRCLTELRKVTNAIVRQYGKPAEIHIELTRDLKQPKKRRQDRADRMRANEKARKAAAKRIVEEAGISDPSPDDIRKVLLADECRWECPYTGKSISMRGLVGRDSQFQIEHIIPFTRSLDNSFLNLTLCYVEENKVKANKTPYEAYSGDPEGYERIRERVKRFQGDKGIVAQKLRRFLMTPEQVEEFLAGFTARQLTDTAYASRLAADYLGLLYGGVVDQAHTRRVQATSGQVTAYLRNLWLLNTILKDGETTHGGYATKPREDHRHHAVDAVAIALTSPATVKQLSDAAQRAPFERRRFASLQAPWPNFVDSVRQEINRIVVSHRVSKKISGALHEETIYSAPVAAGFSPPGAALKGGATDVRHVRKPLASLTKTEIEDIVDPGVRQRVLEKLEEVGGDIKKFTKEENLPFLLAKDGRRIPIKRVRLRKKTPTVTLGEGRRAREVTPGSNHHIEIFAEFDEHGEEVEWDGQVVSMFEAHQRMKAGQPIVQKNHGPDHVFKFSLAQGEVVECDDKQQGRSLFVFRKVTQLTAGGIQIGFAPLNDARKAREMQVSRAWLWTTPNTLGERHARKVLVSPLGEVSEAHD
jgi:CRISPR-associated endonuclease Csn1